jgi:hypothetical protein
MVCFAAVHLPLVVVGWGGGWGGGLVFPALIFAGKAVHAVSAAPSDSHSCNGRRPYNMGERPFAWQEPLWVGMGLPHTAYRARHGIDPVPAPLHGAGGGSLLERMRQQLQGGRFRWLNEKLYTCEGSEALDLMRGEPELYEQYHQGGPLAKCRWRSAAGEVPLAKCRWRSAAGVVPLA